MSKSRDRAQCPSFLGKAVGDDHFYIEELSKTVGQHVGKQLITHLMDA